MNKNRKKLVGLVVAAGLVGLGVAVAAPALAGNGPGPGGADRPAPERSQDGPQWNDEQPLRLGSGPAGRWREGPGPEAGPGSGPGDGTCWLLPGRPAGELAGAQAATLSRLAEQQQLARDLSAAFADQYQVRVFERVAAAEGRQLETLQVLLERYQLADPTTGLAAGEFASPQLQARYDQLLADGSASLPAALAAGQSVAEEQLTELAAALEEVSQPDLTTAYQHLLAATQRQVAGFEAWSAS